MPLKTAYNWLRRFVLWLTSGRSIKRIILRLVSIGSGFVVLYIAFLWLTLPSIDDPKNLLASESTVIFDRNGVELYRLHGEEDRTFIDDAVIPQSMKFAIVAIEDQRYYDRGCLDLRALARAVVLLGQAGGGSTITRQLARNALNLQQDNRFHRKVKEVVLACQLESKFSKEELLALYLNWIPFGQNAYGVEQASQRYFSHSASGLTLAESSVLASLPQRPTYFSPFGRHVYTEVSESVYQRILDGKITKASQIDGEDITIGLLGAQIGTGSTLVYVGGRTDQVLKNMQDQELITETDRLVALEELSTMQFQSAREDIRAPHFVLWIRDQVEELLAADDGLLEQGGLQVDTTLDWELQQIAEDVVEFHKDDVLNRYGAHNIALLSADVKNGEILAYIGNTDYNDTEHGGKIDMVHAPRQPGSSFKPFVYTAAFLKGYSPATPIYDVPTKLGDDEPQNFDNKFTGLTTIRYALGASRNIPAAKAFFMAGGEDAILALVNNLGVPSPHQRRQELSEQRPEGFDYGWPLALGAAETPLYEMVQGYSTLANAGVRKPLVSIRRIIDKHGNILYQADPEEEDVLDPRVAYLITSVLSDEAARPEEYWRSQLTVPGYQTAAKTGTSNKCLERNERTGDCELLKPDNAWLMGYTPNIVTGVWAGNADSSALFDRGGGLNTASPVWRDYMVRAQRDWSAKTTEFVVPDGVVRPQISLLSGQLPTECTPLAYRRSDVFLQENAPTELDPACQQLVIDRVTRLLASDSCPVEARASGSFLVAHSILPNRWPTWEDGVREWTTKQMEMWYASDNHSGAIIPLPVAPTAYCDLSLTPGRAKKPEMSIVFPSNGGGASYPSFKPRLRYTVGSVVQEVLYEIDGRRVAKVTTEPFEIALTAPRSVSQNGNHTLKVTLVDEYFNQVTDTVQFRFEEDRTPPAINITYPAVGTVAQNNAKLTLKAEARDPGGAIKHVQFYLDDVLLSTKPNEPYEMEYVLRSVEPGVHTIRAVAEDMAENKSSDEVEFSVQPE